MKNSSPLVQNKVLGGGGLLLTTNNSSFSCVLNR